MNKGTIKIQSSRPMIIHTKIFLLLKIKEEIKVRRRKKTNTIKTPVNLLVKNLSCLRGKSMSSERVNNPTDLRIQKGYNRL